MGSDCTGADVTPTADATYTLTVTDHNKRHRTGSVALKVFGPITVSVPVEVDIVRGETASIDATVSGGVPDVTCEWLAGGQVVASGCSGVSVQPTTDTVYDLAVVDSNSDMQVGNTTVRVFDPLTAAFVPTPPQQVLAGDAVTLTPSLAGGVPPLSCTWTQDGAQVSTDCGAYSYMAADSSSLALAVADSQGHTVQATADVAVLKVVPIGAQQVPSNGTLSLDGSATGLVGAAQCAWTDAAGNPLNSGTDCHLDLVVLKDYDLTLTVTDATTGLSASTNVPVTAMPPTCTDGVRNDVETDVDCGGIVQPGWFNEFMSVSIPSFGSIFEAEIVLPTSVDPTTLVPQEYALNGTGTAYVPLAAQALTSPVGTIPGMAACTQDNSNASAGVQTAMCIYSNVAADMAFTVSRPDGSLVDFVLMDNTSPLVPASGGPADGLTPRRLGVTVQSQVYDQMAGGTAPTTDSCLQGTGIRASDFTWHTDCAITMTSFTGGGSAGLNPNQTVTGFRQSCPRCQQGQTCLVLGDCASPLTCDATSLTCGP